MRNHFILSFIFVISSSNLVWTMVKFGKVDGNFSFNNDFLFEGEQLNITCSVSPSDGDTSEDLYITKSNEEIPSTIVNKYTIRLNTTVTINQNRFKHCDRYSCGVRRNGEKRPIKNADVCVRVDKYPKKVEESDLKITVYDWKSMDIQIDLYKYYKYERVLNVSWEYSQDFGCESWYDCPHGNKTVCSWKNDIFSFSVYCLKVVVTNTQRNVTMASDVFEIDPRNYVLPAPVENLSMNSTNRCILATWEHNAEYREKEFIQELTILNGSLVFNMTDYNTSTEVCGLRPYTEYTFSITTLPAVTYNGFPSKTVSRMFRTLEDVPERAVKLSPGGFQEIQKSNNTCRLILLYYQDLEPSERNGEVIGSQMKISSQSGFVIKEKNVTDSPIKFCLPNEESESYSISVNTRTKIGFSNRPSEIQIGPFSEVSKIRHIPFHVEIVGGSERESNHSHVKRQSSHSRVKWVLHGDHEKGYTYTGYYCLRNIDNSCRSEFKAISIPINQKEFRGVVIPGNMYVFGLSSEVVIQGEVISSGIKWDPCLYEENGDIKNPPKKLRGKATDKSLLVEWEQYNCGDTRAFVEGFMVSYCPTTDKKNCTGQRNEVKTRNHADSSLNIEDELITQSDQVLVQVKAFSETVESPQSEVVITRLETNTETIKVIIGVCIGAVAVAVFIVVVITRKICTRKCEKIMKDPGMVEIPLEIGGGLPERNSTIEPFYDEPDQGQQGETGGSGECQPLDLQEAEEESNGESHPLIQQGRSSSDSRHVEGCGDSQPSTGAGQSTNGSAVSPYFQLTADNTLVEGESDRESQPLMQQPRSSSDSRHLESSSDSQPSIGTGQST